MLRTIKTLSAIALIATAGCVAQGVAQDASPITMVGSSSGPSVAAAAEAAGLTVQQAFEGSGAGRAAFCAGGPDVLVLSRDLRDDEAAACAANGVETMVKTAGDLTVIFNAASLVENARLASFAEGL